MHRVSKNPENFQQHFNCTQWTSVSAPIQYQNQIHTQTHLLELPRCNGSRIEDWIDKCDRLFYLHRIPPESKVRIASFHLEGSALQWHLDYMRARFNRYPRWYDYVFDISMRFGKVFDDPLPPVTQVKSSVSLQGYVNEVGSGDAQKPSTPIQNQFSTPNSRVDSQVILHSEHSVNTNLTELKYTTQTLVKLPKPTTIERVATPTKSHETPNTTMKMCKPVTDTPCVRSEPIPNKPVVDKNTHAQTLNTKPIFNKAPRSFNASELADREAKGLCMFCDELFTPEHLLKHKRFKLLVMEREEEDEPLYGAVVDGMELDDGSSTHKFLELDLAEKRNLTPMTVTKRGKRKLQAPHLCRAFNWHLQQVKFISNVVVLPWKCCHMILGAQWLSKLGPSLWNFSRLPMEFFNEGERFVLQKAEILKLPNAIAVLNTTLEDLFAELRHLPLCKVGVDHRIYLKGRNLISLQILCDDGVLESEELKAKMNICEESEAGMDYSNADIVPAEKGWVAAKDSVGKQKHVVDESCQLQAVHVWKTQENGWVYALSKLLTEAAAFKFANENGTDLVSIITTTVAGQFFTSSVPSSVEVLLSPLRKYKGGQPKAESMRDFCFGAIDSNENFDLAEKKTSMLIFKFQYQSWNFNYNEDFN